MKDLRPISNWDLTVRDPTDSKMAFWGLVLVLVFENKRERERNRGW